MATIAVSVFLFLLGSASAVNFRVENRCDFSANVQMQMGGDHSMMSSGFTLGSGGIEQVPVETTTSLSGSFYVANSLPASLAEFELNHGQNGDTDFYSINLSRGANVGLEISPTTPSCKRIKCHSHRCASKLVSCPSGGDYIITFCP